MPRPENLMVVRAAAAVTDVIPGTRPEPRPEIVRVAAALPPREEPAAEPAPRRSGGLFAGNDTCGRTLARAMPWPPLRRYRRLAFFAGLSGVSGPRARRPDHQRAGPRQHAGLSAPA